MKTLRHNNFLIMLLLFLTTCNQQSVVLPTEMPNPIATSTFIPVTVTSSPLPTQSTIIFTVTPSGTPILMGIAISSEQQEEIKRVIEPYFEMRYQALSFPQPDGFQLEDIGRLVTTESDGKAFLDAELVKLALDAKYREYNGSRYVSYKFFLDFKEFSFDNATELVSVLVMENNATTSENSALVAEMSGLKHVIVLRQEQDQWKIVSDYYNDFLWRTARKDGETKEDMLNMISTLEALITPKAE